MLAMAIPLKGTGSTEGDKNSEMVRAANPHPDRAGLSARVRAFTGLDRWRAATPERPPVPARSDRVWARSAADCARWSALAGPLRAAVRGTLPFCARPGQPVPAAYETGRARWSRLHRRRTGDHTPQMAPVIRWIWPSVCTCRP